MTKLSKQGNDLQPGEINSYYLLENRATQIKPAIQYQSNCPHCGNVLKSTGVIWQGIHICAESDCANCGAAIVEDLRFYLAVFTPYQVDLEKGLIFGDKIWKQRGNQILQSLQNPQPEKVVAATKIFKCCRRVIILNCVDYLYGHCLGKLMNAQIHLDHHPDYGLVIIIPKFMRWMVPEGVAEVWTVDIPLKNGTCYYPSLNQFIHQESNRFEEIYASAADSGSKSDITRFTGVPTYNFDNEEFKITFVWREDRLWSNSLLRKLLRKFKMLELAIRFQNWQVCKLFENIRSRDSSTKFAVVGLGKTTQFPGWVEDFRVDRFDEKIEKEVCQIYSKSRVVVGVHGSNMLLPSAHAGITVSLVSRGKWYCIAQDVVFNETHPRAAAFRYRYLPMQTSISELGYIIASMTSENNRYLRLARNHRKNIQRDQKIPEEI